MEFNSNKYDNYPFVPLFHYDMDFDNLSEKSKIMLYDNICNILIDIFKNKQLKSIDNSNILIFDYLTSAKVCAVHTQIFSVIAKYTGVQVLKIANRDQTVLLSIIDNLFKEIGNLSLLYTSNNTEGKINVLILTAINFYTNDFFNYGNKDLIMVLLACLSVQVNYPLTKFMNQYNLNKNILFSIFNDENINNANSFDKISKQLEKFFITL